MVQSFLRGVRVMPINRRHVLAGAAAGLCLPGAAGAAADNEPRLIREDYALARQRFQTHLLERGPAPDQGQPLTPPPGARQIRTDPVRWTSSPGFPTIPIGVLHGRACFSFMAETHSGKVTGISRGPISRPAMSR